MLKHKFKILDPIGLHARPASKLVGVASKFNSKVELVFGEKRANMKSIMNLMALGIKSGAVVEIVFDGSDESAALEATKKIIADEKLG